MAKRKSAAERNRLMDEGENREGASGGGGEGEFSTSPAQEATSAATMAAEHGGSDEAVPAAPPAESQTAGLVDHEAASSPPLAPSPTLPLADAAALAADDEQSSLPVTLPAAARSRSIDVPLGAVPSGAYTPQHLEVRLYEDQAAGRAIKQLLAGLVENRVALAPTHRHPMGKPVSSYADALRWLLQQIGSQHAVKKAA